ncbi:HMCN1-like protein, partial [Mya arenaria]
MHLNNIFILSVIFGIYCDLCVDQFVCYRKHRPKKGECGGRIKRARVTTVKACCEGTGSGFSTSGLDQLGRNRYTCTSCESWEKNQTIPTIPPITTTELPSEWGHWSQCSRTCGSGVRERYRKCTTCDLDDPGNKEIKHCTVHFYCPEPGEWGSWAEWEECSQPCGGGIRRRQRLCDSPEPRHGGADCKGPSEETGLCNEQECKVDGGWMPWTRFGHCSHTCGRGEMLRTRTCTNPAPRGGGQQCVGRSIDARRCEDRKCPVHGGWSDWDPWSSCDSTCGTGKRVRSRACNRPRPDFGGKHCEGGWSQWSYYGPCRAAPCQHGHRLRTRECDSPRPSHGGRMCRGDSVERNPCFNDEGCA